MIAALDHSHVSRKNPSKFSIDGVQFGWEVIEGMLKREVQWRVNNQLPRVPRLKESYMYRDSWTRLNVTRAKIMQVSI